MDIKNINNACELLYNVSPICPLKLKTIYYCGDKIDQNVPSYKFHPAKVIFSKVLNENNHLYK